MVSGALAPPTLLMKPSILLRVLWRAIGIRRESRALKVV
jgi:hypothetical protein